MSEKTVKQKRKVYFLNSPIELIDIDKISTDKSAKQSADELPDDNGIVRRSVRLYDYDEEAPPLLVYRHKTSPECYLLLDGYERIEGARENGSVERLPCIIIEAKNLAEARLIAAKHNAPVYEIREKKNLAFHIIETLDKSYKRRKLTKDLSLRSEELLHLIDLSGESETTCNRALAVFRGIFSELITKNPGCADAGLKRCFLDAIKSGGYPELKDFYKKGISVLSFGDRYFERINNLSSGKKRDERQLKLKTVQVPQAPDSASADYKTASAQLRQTEFALPPASVNSGLNERNREIEFLNRLKTMSSIDEIDLSDVKALIQDFLQNNTDAKPWINLFFNCVYQYWSELNLFLIDARLPAKNSHAKQSANLTANDNSQTEDNQPFLF